MFKSLKDFHIETEIGEGSFSNVFKLRDKLTGQLFAGKRLTEHFKSAAQVEDYQELRVLRKLDHHPNILGLIDVVYEADEGVLILVFNLMDCSLYDVIREARRRPPETRCKGLLHQLVKGVHFLHSNGFMHRDIKPENVLIRRDRGHMLTNPTRAELLQIGDFGTVGSCRRAQPFTAYVGTRWYRAPECLLTHGAYGTKADVWAIGCCFYELLTLSALFPGASDIDQIHKIHEIIGTPSVDTLTRLGAANVEFQQRPRIDWFKLVPHLSAHGVDVLKRMLVYCPARRVSTKKLLEHAYFRQLKRQPVSDSIAARMTLSKTSEDAPVKAYEGRRCKSSVEIELKRRFERHLERGWNMPECEAKKSFVRAMSAAGVNARKISNSRHR